MTVNEFELDPIARAAKRRQEQLERRQNGEQPPREYTVDDLDQLYGFVDRYAPEASDVTPEDEEPTPPESTLEAVDPAIDLEQVARAAAVPAEPDRLGDLVVNGSGLSQDSDGVAHQASAELSSVGVVAPSDSKQLHDLSTATVVATGLAGQGQDQETGRLAQAEYDEALYTVVAVEFDAEVRRGNPEALKGLSLSAAQRVAGWLSEVGRTYGSAEAAPAEAVGSIGRYITFAQKVSAEANEEVITTVDASGEAVVESADELAMRIFEGDEAAAEMLPPAERQSFDQARQTMLQAEDCDQVYQLGSLQQAVLIKQLLRALQSPSDESSRSEWTLAA